MGELLKNYQESNAINYSILSALVSHPREAKAMIDGVNKSTSYFEFGSLVDFLLTGNAPYYDKYLIVNSKPTGSLLALADEYLRLVGDTDVEAKDKQFYILQARKNSNYDSRLKDETVVSKFITGCTEYVNSYLEAKSSGKIIIDAETLEYAQNLVSSAHYEPTTGFYLNSLNFSAYFTQLELFETIYGVECKGKPDIVCVNNDTKLVSIVDVKTYTGNFNSNFWRYHYYLQTPFYGELFKQKFPQYKDYSYEYVNIAIDSNGGNTPEVYKLNTDLINYVLGNEVPQEVVDKYVQFKIRTIPSLIETLQYHISTDRWSHTLDYYEQGFNTLE